MEGSIVDINPISFKLGLTLDSSSFSPMYAHDRIGSTRKALAIRCAHKTRLTVSGTRTSKTR